ncbi:type II secretion system protein [Candidatus Saccharibacteria bacterium]|nr:type II secretion system protein [Candidatus Saccharibacteria bacterium]
MKNKQGFTILEVVIVGVFVALALVLFFVQKGNIDAMERDEKRKIAINAMYYAWKRVFMRKTGITQK